MTELEEKYIKELDRVQGTNDIEKRHFEEDNILCNLLNELGYTDLVNKYWSTEKWYA